MQADTYIPRRLDDQWKIGFWDVDVAAPILFGLFLGYMSGSKVSFALCIATGLLTSRWIARIKADKHPAFAMHWLYWHLNGLETSNDLKAYQVDFGYSGGRMHLKTFKEVPNAAK